MEQHLNWFDKLHLCVVHLLVHVSVATEKLVSHTKKLRSQVDHHFCSLIKDIPMSLSHSFFSCWFGNTGMLTQAKGTLWALHLLRAFLPPHRGTTMSVVKLGEYGEIHRQNIRSVYNLAISSYILAINLYSRYKIIRGQIFPFWTVTRLHLQKVGLQVEAFT